MGRARRPLLNIQREFPQLQNSFQITSPPTREYNCIGWAAGETDRWWWPNPTWYWPPSVRREETVAAFQQAFGTLGYVPCNNDRPEPGIEKIALYADRDGKPTHAARQLDTGWWTSKLGKEDDIQHASPQEVEGNWYGRVTCLMSRPAP